MLTTDYSKFKVDATVKDNFTKAASNDSLKKGADFISNSVYEAVSAVSQSAAAEVQGDVSYEMEVMEVIDQGTATYRVKYLDNDRLQAHAAAPSYTVGDHVLVLVPRGDLDNPLVILNTVTPSTTVVGENKTTPQESKRIEISQNLFNDYNLIKFISYQNETINLSDLVPYNLSDILKGYLDSGYFILKLSMNVKTQLPKEQRVSGNYGIKVEIPIRRKNTQGILKEDVQEFYLDAKEFNGNSYELLSWSNQTNYLIFKQSDEIVFDKKREIKVSAFVNNFPQDPFKIDKDVWADIFIKDICLTVCEDIEIIEGGYKVSLIAEDGPFFANQSASIVEEKKISLKVFLNGLEISYTKMPIYWFIEDPTVNEMSKYYHYSAGVNWRCLNSKTEVLGEGQTESSYVFDTSAGTITISSEDVKYKSKIRCYVGTNEGQLWTYGEITINNLYSLIKSVDLYADKDNATYIENVGNVILTCAVDYPNLYRGAVADEELTYVWEQLDQQGRIVSQDSFYTILAKNDKNITEGIFTTRISFPVSILTSDLNIFRVYTYITKKSKSGTISTFPIETKQISIRTKEGQDFVLVLENANINYNYDADGDAPGSDNYDGLSLQKTEIKPVHFNIVNADTGSEISEAEYNRVSWIWKIPINSLLEPILGVVEEGSQSAITEDDNYYYVHGDGINRNLQYKLANRYNAKYAQVGSSLTVTFNKTILYEDIPIRFSKDGENGTNGTKYTAFVTYKIDDTEYRYGDIYVDDLGNEHHVKMRFVAVEDSTGIVDWYIYDLKNNMLKKCYAIDGNGYTNLEGDLYKLNVKVYKDGEEITTSSSSTTGTASVSWSIFDNGTNQGLKFEENKYYCPFTISNTDATSCYIIPTNDEKTKLAEWSDKNNIPYVIVQANISLANLKAVADKNQDDLNNIYNNDLHIYYDYPIEITRIKTDLKNFETYAPSLEGGYYNVLYSSAGNNPQYDSTENFKCESNLSGSIDEKDSVFIWDSSSNIYLDKNMTTHHLEVEDYNECPIAKPNPLFQSGNFYNYIRVIEEINNKTIEDKVKKENKNLDSVNLAIKENKAKYDALVNFLSICNIYELDNALQKSKEEIQKRSECLDSLQNIIKALNILNDSIKSQTNLSELVLTNKKKIGNDKTKDSFIYDELELINALIVSVLNTKTSVFGIGYNNGNDIASISSLFDKVYFEIAKLYGNGIRTTIKNNVNVLENAISSFNTFNQNIKNKTVTTNYSNFIDKIKNIVENENLIKIDNKLYDVLYGYYLSISEYAKGANIEKNFNDIQNVLLNFEKKLYEYGELETVDNLIINKIHADYVEKLSQIYKEDEIISSSPEISYLGEKLSGKSYSDAYTIVNKAYEKKSSELDENCSKKIFSIKNNESIDDKEKENLIVSLKKQYGQLKEEYSIEKSIVLKSLENDVNNTKTKKVDDLTQQYNNELDELHENDKLIPLEYLKTQYEAKNNELLLQVKLIEQTINSLSIIIDSNKDSVVVIRPINMKCNSYEIPGLNNWDGKKYYLSDNGEYMFCPQIGAGVKSSNNTFTGMFMGARTSVNRNMSSEKNEDLNLQNKDIGLFGYSQGTQSIFLDAKTGAAFMGKPGQGQIVISPDRAFASIYSGNYYRYDANKKAYIHNVTGIPIDEVSFNNLSTQNERDAYSSGEGMLINLTNGSIKTKYWNVNSEGRSNFSSGLIGGWEINSNTLSSVIKDNMQLILDSGNSVGSVTNINNKNAPKIYCSNNINKPHNSLESLNSGFYLGSDGLSIGNTFRIRNVPLTGSSTQGYGILEIGNLEKKQYWTIGQNLNGTSFIGYNATYLISKSFIYKDKENSANEDESIYIGTDGISFGHDLELSASGSLKIGNFKKNQLASNHCLVLEVDQDNKKEASLRFNTNGIHDFKSKSLYVGTQGIRLGKNAENSSRGIFEVDTEGNLYSNAGYIANWVIEKDRLISNKTIKLGNGKVIPTLVLNSSGYIAYNKTEYETNNSYGFYIGKDGFCLGNSFSVNSYGYLNAVKGKIAKWYIDRDSIYVSDSNNNKIFNIYPSTRSGYIAYNTNSWNAKRLTDTAQGCFYLGTSGISLGEKTAKEDSPFRVNAQGKLWSTSGVIGGWNISKDALKGGHVTLDSKGLITAGLLQINGESNGYISYNTSSLDGGEIESNNGRFYLGTAGISLGKGSPFKVTAQGKLYSTSGTIGGWTISGNTLSAGNITLDSNGSIYSKMSPSSSSWIWGFDTSGNLTCTTATIGGVTFTKNGKGTANWTNGQMTSGKIGAWNITTSSIEDESGFVKFFTNGHFEFHSGSDSGLIGTGNNITIAATEVVAGAKGHQLTLNASGAVLEGGSGKLSLEQKNTQLTGNTLNVNATDILTLTGKTINLNADINNIKTKNNKTLKEEIVDLLDDEEVKNKLIDLVKNTIKGMSATITVGTKDASGTTSKEDGHSHSFKYSAPTGSGSITFS